MAGAVEALEIRSYEKQQKDRGCSSWRKETLAGVGGKGDDCESMVCPSWRACRSTLGPMSTFPKRKRSRFIVPAHLSEKRASRGLYQNVKDLGLGMEQGGWSRWRCERQCLEGNQGVKSDGPKEASVRMTEIWRQAVEWRQGVVGLNWQLQKEIKKCQGGQLPSALVLVIEHPYPSLRAWRERSVCGGASLDEEELASRTATVEHQWACEEVVSGHLLPVLLEPVVSGSGTLQRNECQALVEALSGWHLRSRQFQVSAKIPLLCHHDSCIQHLFMQSLHCARQSAWPWGHAGSTHRGEPFSQGSAPGGADREWAGVTAVPVMKMKGSSWGGRPRQMVR